MLDSEKLRDAILKMDHNTEIGHKRVMLQWQDGKRVIVWPEELAPGKARFPTAPWSQRQ